MSEPLGWQLQTDLACGIRFIIVGAGGAPPARRHGAASPNITCKKDTIMSQQKKNSVKKGPSKKTVKKVAKVADDIRRGRFTFKKFIALVVLLLSGFGMYQYAPGKVIKVADGDTVTVYTKDREKQKIRLYGIDAPELKQAWGEEARDFASDLVLLQEVEISVVNADRYGRDVALVKLPNGRILNEELVKQGHAWVYREYCREAFCKNWVDLEIRARTEQVGLWSQKNPTAPWRWRKQNK